MTLVLRLAFWGALIFALVMALLPHPPGDLEIGDKYQHMLAFATLTALAAMAYPRTPLLRIVERMALLGAMIELIQSIPALHRDCDILDWLADMAAVLVVIAAVGAWRRRTRHTGR